MKEMKKQLKKKKKEEKKMKKMKKEKEPEIIIVEEGKYLFTFRPVDLYTNSFNCRKTSWWLGRLLMRIP